MRDALFLLAVIAVFGGIPVLLPRLIRRITESASDRESRKTSERDCRIAQMRKTHKCLSIKWDQASQKALFAAQWISQTFEPRTLFPAIGRALFGLGARILRWFDLKWIFSIVLGTFFVIGVMRSIPPGVWNSEPFATVALIIGIPSLIGGPFMFVPRIFYFAFHAFAIAFASVFFYLVLFHKRTGR